MTKEKRCSVWLRISRSPWNLYRTRWTGLCRHVTSRAVRMCVIGLQRWRSPAGGDADTGVTGTLPFLRQGLQTQASTTVSKESPSSRQSRERGRRAHTVPRSVTGQPRGAQFSLRGVFAFPCHSQRLLFHFLSPQEESPEN